MHDEFWLEEMNPDGFSAGDGIMRGDPGPYYTPAVDANGVISWTNNGNLPNPEPRNIKGPDGKSAYEQAVEGGYEGTEEEFNAELAAVAGATEQIAANTQDISDLKSAKAPVIIDSASGAIVSFSDGADGLPIHKLTVQIEPVQAGSGDPSPDNVRPISGWTVCNIYHSGADMSNPTTYTIAFPTEAGTVYGGTLTINDDGTGKLMVDKGIAEYDGSSDEVWEGGGSGRQYIRVTAMQRLANYIGSMYCDKLQTIKDHNVLRTEKGISGYIKDSTYPNNNWIYVAVDGVGSVAELRTWLTANPITVVYPLAATLEITLTAQQVLNTLYGENNIWADCGDVEVEYRADTKLYIQKINAPADDDMTADAQIASGKYFIIGNNLYLSNTTIPAGDTIIPGTNCTKTNLAEALNALNV